jgi:hypothetical protein
MDVEGARIRRNHAASLAGVATAVSVLAGCAGSPEGIEPKPVVLAGEVPAVQYDMERRELVLAMDPVELPAGVGHAAVQQAAALEAELPVGGWLNGYTVEVVDRAGKPVPREVIHHVNLMAPDRRELFSDIMQRVGAVGFETAPVRIPRLLGYPIDRGDHILVIAELHNPRAEAYEGVRVIVRMPHTAANAWPKPIDVQPFYVDVTPPAELHSFDLPPGRSEQSWQAEAPLNGRILGMGGHLHDLAVELRLEDVTTGEVIWRTEPLRDEEGRLAGMPQSELWWRLGLPVEAGHTYRLVSVYDNPTGATIPDGGMGALGGIIMPTGKVRWPRADRSHAEYRKDVALRITDRDRAPDPMEANAAHGQHVHR